jgi:hypothetical protein
MKDWVPVDIDVKKLTRSSILLNRKLFAPLPPQAQRDIDAVASNQARDVQTGALNPTNLVISGGVSTVMVADNGRRDSTDAASVDPAPVLPDPNAAPAPAPPDVAPAVADNDMGGSGPAPTPNPNPTPSTNPTPSSTPRIISRDPYVISPDTLIATRFPAIATGDTTNVGRIYRGNSIDGSATEFVFDSTEDFDLRSDFDNRFGRNREPEFAPNGVAVFNFRSLQLIGPPTIDTAGGPTDLALVAMNGDDNSPGIRSTGPGGNWDLSGLRSLFLGSAKSSILLDQTIGFFADGPTFQYLQLYARGENSDVVVGSTMRLNRNLYIDTERDTILFETADVRSRGLFVNAGRDVTIGGRSESVLAQLTARRAIMIEGDVRAGTLFGFAQAMQVNGTLDADTLDLRLTGALADGAVGSRITARQFLLTAGAFSLNADSDNGTVFDTAKITLFDANVGSLDLLSNFNLPAGAGR